MRSVRKYTVWCCKQKEGERPCYCGRPRTDLNMSDEKAAALKINTEKYVFSKCWINVFLFVLCFFFVAPPECDSSFLTCRQYHWNKTYCYPPHYRCDKTVDCVDGSDEDGCGKCAYYGINFSTIENVVAKTRFRNLSSHSIEPKREKPAELAQAAVDVRGNARMEKVEKFRCNFLENRSAFENARIEVNSSVQHSTWKLN